MADIVLNEQQRKLAEENHNLIYKFASIKHADLEEFYGVFAIGLCYAAHAFDPERGTKFSTLAYQCMTNEWRNYWRMRFANDRIPPNHEVSLDALELYLGDDGYVYDDTQQYVDKFILRLTKTERTVLSGLLAGYRCTDIARRLGWSRQYIHQTKKEIQNKWLRYAALA